MTMDTREAGAGPWIEHRWERRRSLNAMRFGLIMETLGMGSDARARCNGL